MLLVRRIYRLLLLISSLFFACQAEQGTRTPMTPAQLCAILEDMFLIVPHKLAVGPPSNDPTEQGKKVLVNMKKQCIDEMKEHLASSHEVRNAFKEYFDPDKEDSMTGIKREVGQLSWIRLQLDPDALFYSQRLRRLSIAELLSFLREHVYKKDEFPYKYEKLYNEMVASLHHKTVAKKSGDVYAISFPTSTFNQKVIFKELKYAWESYEKLPDNAAIEKTIRLYKTYQILCFVEGDILEKAEKEEYREIRRKCINALTVLESSQSGQNNISAWFSPTILGLAGGADEDKGLIQRHLIHLKGLFEHYYQEHCFSLTKHTIKEASIDRFEDDLMTELGPSFATKRYRGYIRLIHYLESKGSTTEKEIIKHQLKSSFHDWIQEHYTGHEKRIAPEMPPLPPLAVVKKSFESELAGTTALSALKSYSCGSIFTKHEGYNQVTHNFISEARARITNKDDTESKERESSIADTGEPALLLH
jgi:hypothetical protein